MSPRMNRSELATFTYFHVCARGNDGQNIFWEPQDRLSYLAFFEKYRLKFSLSCYAYCLMTNHIHLLLLSPSVVVLSKAIHNLHVAYVRYFNNRHKRRGHLFEDRFSSWVIRNEKHLYEAKEYIEGNSIKAGLAGSKEEYLWSSASKGAGSDVTLCPINGYEDQVLSK